MSAPVPVPAPAPVPSKPEEKKIEKKETLGDHYRIANAEQLLARLGSAPDAAVLKTAGDAARKLVKDQKLDATLEDLLRLPATPAHVKIADRALDPKEKVALLVADGGDALIELLGKAAVANAQTKAKSVQQSLKKEAAQRKKKVIKKKSSAKK